MKEPGYYAIIPATVRYDNRLNANAKLLYGEITALSSREGYCWANNTYFADLYGVHKDTISEWIKQLKECGHIFCLYENNNQERSIYLSSNYPGELTAPQAKKTPPPGKNAVNPPGKNALHNNTSINNTSSNALKEKNQSNDSLNNISFEEYKEEQGCYLAQSLKPDANDCYPDVWFDKNGKLLTTSENLRLQRNYDRIYKDTQVEIVPRLKTQNLPKQTYVKKTYPKQEPKPSYETTFSKALIAELCKIKGIPELDGKFNHKDAEELKPKLAAKLKELGTEGYENDKVLVKQFGILVSLIRDKDKFHFKNMTSIGYINNNFYKLVDIAI